MTLIGSHAYGLATPESDIDFRGVCIPDDLSYFFGLRHFEQELGPKSEDTVSWTLQKFANMTSKANTQTLEMLFSTEDCIRYVHPVFKQNFLDNRTKFVTKEIYNAVGGYAFSEYRKSLGETTGKLGKIRKEDLAQHGYSKRNASHCIRLMHAGSVALSTGVFPVRLYDAQLWLCRSLKAGEVTLETYKDFYKDYKNRLDSAYEKSTLPEAVDFDWLNKMCVQTIEKTITL